MPYCPGCGSEVIESAEICPHCGTRVGKQKRTQYPRMSNGDLVTGEKSTILAVILGIIIPGTGVMYGGRIGLGIVILLGTVFLSLVTILLLATILFIILGIISWIMGFVLWIYGIWKGYDLCKQNNILWYDYLSENQ